MCNIERVSAGFWLISGKHKQRFYRSGEISLNYALRNPKQASILRAKRFRDILHELGEMLLKQVESGKIHSIDQNNPVKHDLEPDWSIRWY